MRTTMDKAGRIVVPASLRQRLGLTPGAIEITTDGAGLHIEGPAANNVTEQDKLLVIESEEPAPTAEDIREFRLADQR